jgi:hypothetical protein
MSQHVEPGPVAILPAAESHAVGIPVILALRARIAAAQGCCEDANDWGPCEAHEVAIDAYLDALGLVEVTHQAYGPH